MAIAQAMCTAFKSEVLKATHNFSASGGNSFKLALYAEGGGGKSSTRKIVQRMVFLAV